MIFKLSPQFIVVYLGFWSTVCIVHSITGCNQSETSNQNKPESARDDTKFKQSILEQVEELYSRYRTPPGPNTPYEYAGNCKKALGQMLEFAQDDTKAPVVSRALAEGLCKNRVFVYADYIVLWRGFKLLRTHSSPDVKIKILKALVTKIDNRELIRKDFRKVTDEVCLIAIEFLAQLLQHEVLRMAGAHEVDGRRWQAFRQWFDRNVDVLRFDSEKKVFRTGRE